MMMLKKAIITGTLPDGNNSTAALNQQLLLEYSSITKNQITDGVDTEKNLSVKHIAVVQSFVPLVDGRRSDVNRQRSDVDGQCRHVTGPNRSDRRPNIDC